MLPNSLTPRSHSAWNPERLRRGRLGVNEYQFLWAAPHTFHLHSAAVRVTDPSRPTPLPLGCLLQGTPCLRWHPSPPTSLGCCCPTSNTGLPWLAHGGSRAGPGLPYDMPFYNTSSASHLLSNICFASFQQRLPSVLIWSRSLSPPSSSVFASYKQTNAPASAPPSTRYPVPNDLSKPPLLERRPTSESDSYLSPRPAITGSWPLTGRPCDPTNRYWPRAKSHEPVTRKD